ncbi:MAG: U32 family peptidase, partial [Erysipelotrichaceae bacterium]|nr:U32 family peptidase [Erysipelotrichaceae bacterium]
MRKIELLAPAGSKESLIAAVESGADAVYLGGNHFGARAFANNFDHEGMREAIEYCHLRDVKVYVTMNTLLFETEIDKAIEEAYFLYKAGADALLV